MEKYITVFEESTAEYSEKSSRFIAALYHCESEEQASQIISQTRSKYWDARHNVYAYILRDGTARFSDDGEPHGTAGKPILDVLKGSGAVDAIIIVTRYFGGVLLGTGGLVKAYSTSSRDAVLAARLVEMCPATELSVVCGYSEHAKLASLIENNFGVLENTLFTDKVEVIFSLKNEDVEAFKLKLCEAFSSRLEAVLVKEKYFSFEIKK